jgi:hypothetical protein
VNGVNGSDSRDCKSPPTACQTIGHAISLAASGDAVIIAAATYHEHLTIPVSLTVTGAGAVDTIVDGGGFFAATPGRVVTIPNTATNVTISNLTLQNGNAIHGAGVYNQGTLTINNSVISENLAKGHSISLLYGLGGGIYNNGTLTINRSTIMANEAYAILLASGGGIYNLGNLTINASTLSGNNTAGRYTSEGGGISNAGTLVVNNGTVTGNYARLGLDLTNRLEGGGIVNGGILSINSSTVSGNLGGIVGAATLQNSIVANNGSGGNCNGPVTSTFSLSSDATCRLNGPGDVNSTNPRLGTLGPHGGPTQTIPLLSGSPAIDAGNPSGCTDGLGHLLKTDQRGLPRPDTGERSGCDMGAYESQSPPPATHFSVSAPSTVQQANPFTLTVTARDAANNLVASYAGTVHFSSTDAQAVLPGNSKLTNGMGVFSATLRTTGYQTITATDTVTASISGTSSPIVVITQCRTRGEFCSFFARCCAPLRCITTLFPPGRCE